MVDDARGACPLGYDCYLADLCRERARQGLACKSGIVIGRGDFLYRDWADRDNTYVLLKGLLTVSAIGRNGESFVMGVFGRGSALGETEPFGGDRAANYLLVAQTECAVCKVSSSAVVDLAGRDPRFARKLYDSTSRNYSVMNQHTWMLSSMRPLERVRRFFLNIAYFCPRADEGILVDLTHGDIARLVGSERTTVTRALGRLEQAGQIRLAGYGSIILNPRHFDASLDSSLVPYPTWGYAYPQGFCEKAQVPPSRLG